METAVCHGLGQAQQAQEHHTRLQPSSTRRKNPRARRVNHHVFSSHAQSERKRTSQRATGRIPYELRLYFHP